LRVVSLDLLDIGLIFKYWKIVASEIAANEVGNHGMACNVCIGYFMDLFKAGFTWVEMDMWLLFGSLIDDYVEWQRYVLKHSSDVFGHIRKISVGVEHIFDFGVHFFENLQLQGRLLQITLKHFLLVI